ncbi:FAD-dependent monooxygenase [Streptomyces sp. NPDC023838]|uniref:FAD-dependent oxidoreductase n=1 Tax=Streptomyces sp. NPDC023838 TaxID=3154325 RepID=UPI0033EA9C9D
MNTSRALVLGGGLAGVLAAHLLADHFSEVLVIERDTPAVGPVNRKGIPQGRHAHVLNAGGARVLDTLLPGVVDDLVEAGAHRLGLPDRLVCHTSAGWMRRFPHHLSMVASSRPLLDWTVLSRVMAAGKVQVHNGHEVVGLIGDQSGVRGVRVRIRTSGRDAVIEADAVVDATGRGSHTTDFLKELGFGPIQTQTVDSGTVYSTRVYQAPEGAEEFPMVTIQGQPRSGRPGMGALVLPVEGGRWMVTLSGTRGAEPPTDPEGFAAFARALPDPAVTRLIDAGEALTAPRGFRATANVRHRFDRARRWPAGFVAVGDAVARFNPVYGHGMSAAIRSVAILGTCLRRHGLDWNGARKAQRAIGRAFEQPWLVATAQDVLYPNVVGARRPRTAKAWVWFFDRLTHVASGDPVVLNALLDAYSLSRSFAVLCAPRVLFAVARGPVRPALEDAPFSNAELRILHARS